MPLSIDPQIGAALKKMGEAGRDAQEAAVGDWQARRRNVEVLFARTDALHAVPSDVRTRDDTVRSFDGAEVKVRWFVNGARRRPLPPLEDWATRRRVHALAGCGKRSVPGSTTA